MARKRSDRPIAPSGVVRETPSEYRVTRRISATEAARSFSDLLNRVRYRGDTFLIERSGIPIGELRPASAGGFTGADLEALLEALPPIDPEYLDAVENAARRQPQLPESPWEP